METNLNSVIGIVWFFMAGVIVTYAQNVNIPDPNFKAVLVSNPAINTNSDTEIQVSEAASYTLNIDASYQNISDLTGIEAFTALDFLNCDNNQLTSLNVSENIALTNLHCSHNQLTSLNLSTNSSLSIIWCIYNQINTLNLPTNTTTLTELYVDNNWLTSLNISAYTSVVKLTCTYNDLAALNLKNGNNTNFIVCQSQLNTYLYCIQVDDAAYSNSASGWDKNTFASYSENCGFGINDPQNIVDAYSIYPNPGNGIFNIQTMPGMNNQYNIEIVNEYGEIIYQQMGSQTTNIDLVDQPKGFYFIRLISEDESVNKKLIIQ